MSIYVITVIKRADLRNFIFKFLCNDRLEFIHCYTGLPGSVHDMREFLEGVPGIQQRCTEDYFPENSHILRDSAYALQKHIMVPYRDNGHLTVEQTYFNKALSSNRMMVERAIGLFKGRWRYFNGKLPMRRTDLIPSYMMCPCVLHNICLKSNDTFEYPIIIPGTIDRVVEPLGATDLLKQESVAERDIIKKILNN